MESWGSEGRERGVKERWESEVRREGRGVREGAERGRGKIERGRREER